MNWVGFFAIATLVDFGEQSRKSNMVPYLVFAFSAICAAVAVLLNGGK